MPRGFQNLTPERRKEVASMGGKTAHREGHAHTWNSKTASIAGKKGAEAKAKKRELTEADRRLLKGLT